MFTDSEFFNQREVDVILVTAVYVTVHCVEIHTRQNSVQMIL